MPTSSQRIFPIYLGALGAFCGKNLQILVCKTKAILEIILGKNIYFLVSTLKNPMPQTAVGLPRLLQKRPKTGALSWKNEF